MTALSISNEYKEGKRIETKVTEFTLYEDYLALASLFEKLAEAVYTVEKGENEETVNAAKNRAEQLKKLIEAKSADLEGYEGAV